MFKIADLPYNYGALEPHIDAQTMELHYEKHHRSYLDKLNIALEKVDKKPTDIETLLVDVDHYNNVNIRNNAGGYYNHTLFWSSMSPNPSKGPSGLLEVAINNAFVDLTQFIHQFTSKAAGLFGSGWTWLCSDENQCLTIVNTSNQDNPLMYYKQKRLTPILGLDVWEHAYYLKYQHRRTEYIQAFWQVLDWYVLSKRYSELCQ